MGETTSLAITTEETGPDAPKAPVAEEGKPVWVPEKFWKDGKVDSEGMARSYSELEKLQGGKLPSDVPAEETTPADAEKVAADAAAAAPSSIPGVSVGVQDACTKDLTETGVLSETSYESLSKAGYSRETVDAYVRGINADQASGEAAVKELKGIVGGEEQYSVMSAWMMATLTPAEITGYNKSVTSRDRAVIELAVRGMHAKYAAANGTDPQLLGGRAGSQGRGEVYESIAQLTRDQRDPLYKTDEAFRKRVSDKLSRSSIM